MLKRFIPSHFKEFTLRRMVFTFVLALLLVDQTLPRLEYFLIPGTLVDELEHERRWLLRQSSLNADDREKRLIYDCRGRLFSENVQQ